MSSVQQPPDYMLAFRRFLINPEEADRQVTKDNLIQLNTLLKPEEIHYQHVPEFNHDKCDPNKIRPYLWYGQGGTTEELFLNCSSHEPDVISINIEIYSVDPGISQMIELYVVNSLRDYGNPRTGSPFGSISVQDIVIGAQDDDYIPFALAGDTSYHIQTFVAEIYPLWPVCKSKLNYFGYETN